MNRLFSNKDLRKLILPLVLEQALAITVGMADTMMISSAGEAAVSGVSIVDMINMLIFSVLSALSTGGAVVVSQNIGAAKMEEAVKQTKGVKDATLSFMTLKLKVEFEDGVDVNAVMKEALKNCKKVEDDCEIYF